jgi:hypothetical protein
MLKRFLVFVAFVFGMLVSVDASAAWRCTVEADRQQERGREHASGDGPNGRPHGPTGREEKQFVAPWRGAPPAIKDRKKWEYPIAHEKREDAVAHARTLFLRDFDNRDGWTVVRSSIVVMCDEATIPPPKYSAPNSATPANGKWTCHVAGAWQGMSKGKFANGVIDYSGVGFAGKNEGEALAAAYAAMQNNARVYDLAGLVSVSWGGLTGRCWDGVKPPKPLGWYGKFMW